MPEPDSSQGTLARLQRLYHARIPDALRFPVGRARRALIDRWIRITGGHGPLPPGRMLQKVQLTPWVMEYLEVGERGAETVRSTLTTAGLDRSDAAVLDFGCGLGRTLRHLRALPWSLSGCDVDAESIAWTRKALPEVPFENNGTMPPLPYGDDSFDAVYAISVFTHFDPRGQAAWAQELARVLRPGGLALITTMGPWAFHPFPEGSVVTEVEGFWFFPVGGAFNNSAAVHTREGLEHFFSPRFELLDWKKQGLDGFQDLALFRAGGRSGGSPSP